MTRTKIPLVFFPGLGADESTFKSQLAQFPQLRVPGWIPPVRGESLAEYCRRMGGSIDVKGPFFVGGCSFGGAVAMEVARHRRPLGVFLIASPRRGLEVPFRLRLLETVCRPIPDMVVRFFKDAVLPLGVRCFGRLNREQRIELTGVIRRCDVDFLRWGAAALMSWTGVDGLDCPVHQIHGDCDRILPRAATHSHVVVPGGGHLINETHAEIVNAFIEERIAITAQQTPRIGAFPL